MELQVGVKVLLKNPEGKYLLMRRSAAKYPEMPMRWDIPGGRINPGTALLDNLARELMEETGLSLVGEPKLLGAQDILCVEGRHVVRLTYIGATKGEPVLSDEHDEYKWATLSEVNSEENLDSYLQSLLKTVTA